MVRRDMVSPARQSHNKITSSWAGFQARCQLRSGSLPIRTDQVFARQNHSYKHSGLPPRAGRTPFRQRDAGPVRPRRLDVPLSHRVRLPASRVRDIRYSTIFRDCSPKRHGARPPSAPGRTLLDVHSRDRTRPTATRTRSSTAPRSPGLVSSTCALVLVSAFTATVAAQRPVHEPERPFPAPASSPSNILHASGGCRLNAHTARTRWAPATTTPGRLQPSSRSESGDRITGPVRTSIADPCPARYAARRRHLRSTLLPRCRHRSSGPDLRPPLGRRVQISG
jgi:hypothetical protein